MIWNHPDPKITSFPALLCANQTAPERVAIRNADGRQFTYGELWSLSGRLAHSLVKAGVRKGDRVAVQVDKSPEVIALFLACARVGAAFLPLNTAYTLAEVEFFVGDAEPKVLVAAPGKTDDLTSLGKRNGIAKTFSLGVNGDGSLMDTASSQPEEFSDIDLKWDDLIAILYTSGTTGRSKGAMLTHGNLASNALALIATWRINSKDVLLHALPVYHTHGLFTSSNTLMLAGGTMLFFPKFDAEQTMKHMPEATIMMGVPTFYTRLLDHPGLTKDATAHMRLFISGSAPLLAETHQEFERRTGHAILERYGMTETNMNTSNPYDGDRIAGTVGFPLPGVSVRIADPNSGTELAQGEIGMIEVQGPNVFTGYWRMPEKTAEEFREDGYFITGDLGQIDERGYISIVGRGKDLIISGGFNVYPKEVESEIDDLTGVLESAVIGVPHSDFGEGVTAVIVRSQGGDTPTETEIQKQLSGRLAKFKLPKRIVFVDELPRNAMGKVQKAVLRTTYSKLYQ